MTCTISQMLTHIRNAAIKSRGSATATAPYSRFKLAICNKLKESGYLEDLQLVGRDIRIKLKHDGRKCRINHVTALSTPSKHFHLDSKGIRKYCSGRKGVFLISTSSGLLTNHESLQQGIGGKMILHIS